MKGLEQSDTLKPSGVKESDFYLGAKVVKFYIDESNDPEKPCWSMSSDKYIKSAIANIKVELEKIQYILPTCIITSLSARYRTELDTSKELNSKQVSFYQDIIGTLRWICELGCIDIMMLTNLMASQMMCPRKEHLEQTLHIFA